MLNFFYSLYLSLIVGSWSLQTSNPLTQAINRTASLILNTLGGHYESVQSFTFLDSGLSGEMLLAVILACVTMIGVCLLVWRLTKGLFSIFFGGR